MKPTNAPILVLINGISGAGKDTFVEAMPIPCANMHRSDPFKEYLKSIGWDGARDEKSRTILKYLVDIGEESGYNEAELCNRLLKLEMNNIDTSQPNILFYHVRDINTIDKIKHSSKVWDIAKDVVSLLIYRDSVEPTEPNEWYDVNSYKKKYDYVVYNNDTIERLKNKSIVFYKILVREVESVDGEI